MNVKFTDHLSGLGREMGRVCLCVQTALELDDL